MSGRPREKVEFHCKMVRKATRQPFVDECAKRLLDNNIEGKELISEIKKRYKLTSVNNFVVDIKKAVLATLDFSPLTPFEGEPGVREFLQASVAGKREIQAAHAAEPSWSEDAEAALKSIKILPASMDSFHFDKEDIVALKRAQEAKRILKNRNPIIVEQGEALLEWADCVIRSPEARCVPELAFALLLVSGRRSAELLNGKSSFTTIEGEAHACIFLGQLKLKTNAQVPYKIPLLIECHAFQIGYENLRSKIGNSLPSTNKDVSAMFASILNDWLQEGIKRFSFFPKPNQKTNVTPHTFRAIYAALSYHLFDSDVTFCAWAQQALGHQSLEESLSYSSVKLKGCGDAGRLGRFTTESEGVETVSDSGHSGDSSEEDW